MKPGVKSTEFWVALVTSLVGPLVSILIVAGVFDADVDPQQFSDQFNQSLRVIIEQAVVVVGLITGAVTAKGYTEARTAVKLKE